MHEQEDLRYFAGLAMQAIISKQGIPETEAAREEIALWSYRMGQAMMNCEQKIYHHGHDEEE